MESNEVRLRKCPKCGKAFAGQPAISRADNKTLICSDCGTREALQSIGVKGDEQEEILKTIHAYTG